MTIPPEYLALTLAEVLGLYGPRRPEGGPTEVTAITGAIQRLAADLAAKDAAKARDDREWLAGKLEQIPMETD